MSGRIYKPGATLTLYRPDGSSFFSEPGHDALVIGGPSGTGLRIQFSIEKTSGSEPNKAEITVSNLAEGTRGLVAKKPLSLVLAAGYDGNLRRLFRGDVRWVDTKKSGGTYDTTILVGDGDRAYAHARVNKSWPPGTRVAQVVRHVAGKLGVPDEVTDRELQRHPAAAAATTSGGTVATGSAAAAATKILEPFGIGWSIQDGELVLLTEDAVRPGLVWPVDVVSGMIEEPEIAQPDKKGGAQKLTVRVALYPEISPGSQIKLSSRKINGTFKVERVRHTGDTEGGPWVTEVECKIANTTASAAPARRQLQPIQGHS